MSGFPSSQTASSQADVSWFRHRSWRGAILVVFLALGLAGIVTGIPQGDEAFYANPAYNMMYNGNQGVSLVQLPDYMSATLARHVFFMPPGYFYITWIWYHLAGFGLLQVRLLSLLFAVVTLLSWYTIVRCLLNSTTAGVLAMAFVSVDYFFLTGASHGRPDLVCIGFGSAGMAAYLALRDRSPAWAFSASHALATLSILQHPVGLVYWLCLAFLIVYLDRRLISMKSVAAAAAPCLVGIILWGVYISQDVPAFFEQWRAALIFNTNAFNDPGLSKVKVIRGLQLELLHRYLGPFGFLPGVGLLSRLKTLVLASYLAGVLGMIFVGASRQKREWLALPILALIAVNYLAFASPSKFAYYLPHVTPFMAACLAAFLVSFRPQRRWLSPVVLAVLGSLQVGGYLYVVRQNGWDRIYRPLMAAIARETEPKTLILGAAELWYGVQPQRTLVSDPTLGYRSGVIPTAFVYDSMYAALHENERHNDPGLYLYVESIVNHAEPVYSAGSYRLFRVSADVVRQARAEATALR